jgi:hypothetical protein
MLEFFSFLLVITNLRSEGEGVIKLKILPEADWERLPIHFNVF